MSVRRLLLIFGPLAVLGSFPASAQFAGSSFSGGVNPVPSFGPPMPATGATSTMSSVRTTNGALAAAQRAKAAASGAPSSQPNDPANHMQYHGLTGYNVTGVPAAGNGSLNFTTAWTANSAGETPDLDSHVLLPAGYGPYTVTGGSSPTGANTPFRPWPLGSAEFERNVYYVQPNISFSGATATFSGDVDGRTTFVGSCARSGGACEEVRITGTVPTGEYRQQTYRPLAPSPPPNPSGAGSTFQTTVWNTPGVVIDSVTVNGVRQYADQLGDFRTAAMAGSLLTDTSTSPEVIVNVRNVAPHAQGTLQANAWVQGQPRSSSLTSAQSTISAHNDLSNPTSGRSGQTYGSLVPSSRDFISLQTVNQKYQSLETSNIALINRPHASSGPNPLAFLEAGPVGSFAIDFGLDVLGLENSKLARDTAGAISMALPPARAFVQTNSQKFESLEEGRIMASFAAAAKIDDAIVSSLGFTAGAVNYGLPLAIFGCAATMGAGCGAIAFGAFLSTGIAGSAIATAAWRLTGADAGVDALTNFGASWTLNQIPKY